MQLRPGIRRRPARVVHFASGAVLLTTALVAALPSRSWSGLAFYGVGGLLVAFLPALRYRLRGLDPGSLATRLSLVLAAATSLPVVITLGLLEAGRRTAPADDDRVRAFVLLLAAVGLAVLIGIGAARSLARPLRRLAEAADRLAAGEPAPPLEITGISELDRLSFNFRHMRDRLAERSAEADDLARELRRRADDLAEADRRKDEFLAMLAHELRNPLGAIGSASHLLAGDRDRRRAAAAGHLGDQPADAAPGAPGGRPARRLAHHPRQGGAEARAHRPARRGGAIRRGQRARVPGRRACG